MKQRNKEQKRKVHSIRGQFAWIFIGLMIGTILLCLMINYLFLGKVYMQSKLDVIHAMTRKNLPENWMMCAEATT